MVAVALITAPEYALMIKGALLILMMWESCRNDRCLKQRCGWLQRESEQCWRWQGDLWRLRQPLRWLPNAVLLVGKTEQGKTRRMWIWQDTMQQAEWRALRACCLNEQADLK